MLQNQFGAFVAFCCKVRDNKKPVLCPVFSVQLFPTLAGNWKECHEIWLLMHKGYTISFKQSEQHVFLITKKTAL